MVSTASISSAQSLRRFLQRSLTLAPAPARPSLPALPTPTLPALPPAPAR